MARVYQITEEEMLSLIESLELHNMRAANYLSKVHDQATDDIHRGFHMVAVRWAQKMGFGGYRKS